MVSANSESVACSGRCTSGSESLVARRCLKIFTAEGKMSRTFPFSRVSIKVREAYPLRLCTWTIMIQSLNLVGRYRPRTDPGRSWCPARSFPSLSRVLFLHCVCPRHRHPGFRGSVHSAVYLYFYWVAEFVGLWSWAAWSLLRILSSRACRRIRAPRGWRAPSLGVLFVIAMIKTVVKTLNVPRVVVQRQRLPRSKVCCAFANFSRFCRLPFCFFFIPFRFGKNLRGILLGYGFFVSWSVLCLALVAAGVAKADSIWSYTFPTFLPLILSRMDRASLVLSTESSPGSGNPSRTGISARCRCHPAAFPRRARLPGKGGRLVISIPVAILICSVVMLSLALLATRGSSVKRELAFRTDVPLYDETSGDPSLCPPEFAARIFSSGGLDFRFGRKVSRSPALVPA